LILYIAGYGLLFVMGMVNISQMNLVIKAVKIGAILALTMPNSWTFFYDNFFKLFLDGSAVLISESLNSAFQSQYVNCPALPSDPNNPYLNDIPNPFCFLDFGFSLLFTNKSTWMKFASLMVLTPITFIMFWFMVYGLVMYVVAIFKAVVSYMLSIAAIAILLLLAPIFIPFILFEQTQSLFSSWLKFLIQYTIGPVLLLIGLNVITMLLYLTVQQVLDFTVCWGCRWNVTIPEGLANLGSTSTTAFCLQWFVPYGYSPAGAGASTQGMGLQFIYFVFFILILDLMKNYGSYVQQITSQLADLKLQKFRTGGGGGEGSIPSKMFDTLKRFGSSIVGQDQGSIARRRNLIESRRAKRKTGANVTMDEAASASGANTGAPENIDDTGNPAGSVGAGGRSIINAPARLPGPAIPPPDADTDAGAPPPDSGRRRR
jgi:type IV secretion system protein VirB6